MLSLQVALLTLALMSCSAASEASPMGEDFELNLSKATGGEDKKDGAQSKLSKVFQLSGFSDPVYVEAYVNVHQYDIVLDGMTLAFRICSY